MIAKQMESGVEDELEVEMKLFQRLQEDRLNHMQLRHDHLSVRTRTPTQARYAAKSC